MGILQNSAKKAHENQKKALIAEAKKAGTDVVAIHEDGPEDGRGVLGGALKSLVGGSLAVDTVQVFQLETPKGTKHLYVQPYAGVAPIPGEHHLVMDGALPAPIVLKKGLLSTKWSSPNADLAKRLNKTGALMKAAKRCKFEWPTGLSKIELSWAAQVLALGDGRTQIMMQPGRYGGFTTYAVGFKQFLDLCRAFHPLLQEGPREAHLPIEAIGYDDLFRTLLLGETAPVAASAATTPNATPHATTVGATDLSDVIRRAAAPHEGKKVHVRSIPPKKEKNVRERVLPPEAQASPIVAMFDLTTFGSAKDAVVFTATHCYAHEMDERVAFAYTDIESVGGFDGMLRSNIVVNLHGAPGTKLPCAGEETLLEVIEKIAGTFD